MYFQYPNFLASISFLTDGHGQFTLLTSKELKVFKEANFGTYIYNQIQASIIKTNGMEHVFSP